MHVHYVCELWAEVIRGVGDPISLKYLDVLLSTLRLLWDKLGEGDTSVIIEEPETKAKSMAVGITLQFLDYLRMFYAYLYLAAIQSLSSGFSLIRSE